MLLCLYNVLFCAKRLYLPTAVCAFILYFISTHLRILYFVLYSNLLVPTVIIVPSGLAVSINKWLTGRFIITVPYDGPFTCHLLVASKEYALNSVPHSTKHAALASIHSLYGICGPRLRSRLSTLVCAAHSTVTSACQGCCTRRATDGSSKLISAPRGFVHEILAALTRALTRNCASTTQ